MMGLVNMHISRRQKALRLVSTGMKFLMGTDDESMFVFDETTTKTVSQILDRAAGGVGTMTQGTKSKQAVWTLPSNGSGHSKPRMVFTAASAQEYLKAFSQASPMTIHVLGRVGTIDGNSRHIISAPYIGSLATSGNIYGFGTATLSSTRKAGTTWGVITLVANGANSFIYYNKTLVASGNLGTTSMSQFGIGGAGNAAATFGGAMQMVAMYSGALTQAQIEANVDEIIRVFKFTGVDTICKGDSLTAGTGATAGFSYPSQLYSSVTDKLNFRTPTNLGIGGETIATALANINTELSPYITPYYPNQKLILWQGTNDLGGGASGTAVYNNLMAYRTAAINLGIKAEDIYIATAIARNFSSLTAMEAERTILNNAIRANTGINKIDLAADARLSNFNDLTYFNADRVHLIDAGQAVVASLAKTRLGL